MGKAIQITGGECGAKKSHISLTFFQKDSIHTAVTTNLSLKLRWAHYPLKLRTITFDKYLWV